VAKVTVAERLAHLRALLRRGRFTFSEAVARTDRVTVAVTLYALLELYKQGEATWTQDAPFAEITIESLPALRSLSRVGAMSEGPFEAVAQPRRGGDAR
jgi:chromatin segregation and condensation protein Rec8/ScpA/Scc1 (kleisin family)